MTLLSLVTKKKKKEKPPRLYSPSGQVRSIGFTGLSDNSEGTERRRPDTVGRSRQPDGGRKLPGVPAFIVQPTKTTRTALWDRLEALRPFRSSYGQSCEVGRVGMKSSKTADRLGEQTRGDLSRAGRGRGLFKTTQQLEAQSSLPKWTSKQQADFSPPFRAYTDPINQ